MSDFKILDTNHTSFTVSDLDATLAYFRDVLGFAVTPKLPRGPNVVRDVTGIEGAEITVAFVDAPGHRIELIEYAAPADRSRIAARPCDTGATHIAFDVDDIDAAIAASANAGFAPLGTVAITDAGPNKGGRIVYLRNADGLAIELIQKPRALALRPPQPSVGAGEPRAKGFCREL